ncbi:hypothetical protein A2U01_0080755, partial [Trifolium medium]|nr:hypothetical protein [Trifolium medium]
MDARIDELERRFQESEERNQQRLHETLARMEALIAAMQSRNSGQINSGDPRTRDGSIHGDGDRRFRKVDLPVFNGDDAPG